MQSGVMTRRSVAKFSVTLLVIARIEKPLGFSNTIYNEYEARGEHGDDNISKQTTSLLIEAAEAAVTRAFFC